MFTRGQTGKSTLLAQARPDLTINLAREGEFLRYSSDIDLFSTQIEDPDLKTVFVDEIQRIQIQAEALSRNIQGFARFLVTWAAGAGQVLDFSKLSARSKVSRTSSIRFVEILEDTLIAERVTSFDGATGADVVRHPKLYFFDVGVLNGLVGNFRASSDRTGLLFEHLVLTQIRNSALAQDLPVDIQFFRTRHGLEVDFIVTLRGEVWAIEAKSGDAREGDLTGLRAFREYFPAVKQCVLVTPREKKRRKDSILICDWITLLQEMGL